VPFLAPLFRSFQPLENPLGFGASDFLVLALAVFLVTCILLRPWIETAWQRIVSRPAWCLLLIALLPVALRLALLPRHPAPAAATPGEFSRLLEAGTLRRFRLANPPHEFPQFFETFFVLQEPTYSSIDPVGQGLPLAIGHVIFGTAWGGVVLSVAAFCALCYWMLLGWTTPGWAFAGGLLAVIEFGPLNLWMNGYSGGAFAASAGCVVFGALPRLKESWRARYAVILGIGVALLLLTRPYESIFLVLGVALYLLLLDARREWRPLGKAAAIAFAVALPAIGLMLLENQQVTGSWTTTPTALSQYQYGVPPPLTFQPAAVPHRQLTPQQQLDYKIRSEAGGGYFERLEYRVRFYRFFFLPTLYLALIAFLATLREFRFQWVVLMLLLFALGVNFIPAFEFHDLAACVCLFILMSVAGLRRLSFVRIGGWAAGRDAAVLLLLLCAAHFLLWYGAHLFDDREWSAALRQYEVWDAINHSSGDFRTTISRQLEAEPGKQLVFVRYWPAHALRDEWVYNAADIDSARVVWARDLGEPEDEKLRGYYKDRTAWILEPDARPPRLTRYQAPQLEQVQ